MSQTFSERQLITIDCAAPTTRLRHFWSATGYANADFTYTRPFLKMYDYLSSFHGHLHYMRLHNILSLHGAGDTYFLEWDMTYGNRQFAFGNRHNGDDKLVKVIPDGTLQYNWELVDQVYDVIIEHGMAPIVEMVYIPSAIRKNDEDFYLPKNYKVYSQVVQDFVLHCQARYGKVAVRGWYFEIWNEPDNEALWCEDSSSFFALYDYMENAVHSVDASLRVGGPATMQKIEGYTIFQRFLQHCANEVNYCTGTFGTRVDFISVHCKGGHPTDFNPSTTVMFDSVRRYLDVLRTFPQFQNVEFFNDESDIIWAGSKGVEDSSWFDFRNTHYAPGFVCKMVSLYCTQVQDTGINFAIADSDNAHLQWERSLFSGNRSQLTPLRPYPCEDLIKKPFFNAYPLLARLGNERLQVRSDASGFDKKFGVLATRLGATLSCMVWNFEDGISDAYGERNLQIALQNHGLQSSYKLVEYRIDHNHSNANRIWRELGHPKAPNKEQITLLRAHEDLELAGDICHIELGDECYTISLSLPQHAVSLLLFVPQNATPPAVAGIITAKQEKGSHGEEQVFLKWTPNAETDFLYYRILRKINSGSYKVLCDRRSLNTAVYTDMWVENGNTYTYKIVPVNASLVANNEGAVVTLVVE